MKGSDWAILGLLVLFWVFVLFAISQEVQWVRS